MMCNNIFPIFIFARSSLRKNESRNCSSIKQHSMTNKYFEIHHAISESIQYAYRRWISFYKNPGVLLQITKLI